jgi:Na+-transporting methylmalonyl-CoA/oxaloacetate decarboxylase gamma subunit
MSLAVIWHYWIGLVFFFLSILVVVGVVIGYLVKVESLKYPKTRR